MISKAIEASLNRRVSAEEFRHELERAIGAEEREEVISLVRWFRRRYPSAEARLAYVRRAYGRWQSGA